jgi:hypothetical protein
MRLGFVTATLAAGLVSLATAGLAQQAGDAIGAGSGTTSDEGSTEAGGGDDGSSSDSDSTSAYPDIGWYDLHNHNRAIAFGTALLQANGGDVASWQEVRAYGWCDGVVIGMPVPSRPVGDDDTASSADKCGWSVYYTTQYRLEVCPNGRAFILRTGEGVDLKSRSEGDVFMWTEAAWCDGGPELVRSNTQDSHRPLDVRAVTKVPMR